MHHPLGGTYLGCGGAHATIVLEAARNAEEDYRKHRDGHHHPSNAGRDEPASAQGSAGGWRAHPTVSSTVLSCPFSHHTTLQHYRLLERVMNSIRNGLGMRETEIASEPN